MGVRLNKVLTELNIGLQQAIDFLKQEKEFGEIGKNANMNTKITDMQYEILKREFSQNKYIDTTYRSGITFPKKRYKKNEHNCKECGYSNAPENNYCVKCGNLLEGNEEKIVASESYYLWLNNEHDKLQKTIKELSDEKAGSIEELAELKEKGFAPSGFLIISEKEYVEFEKTKQMNNQLTDESKKLLNQIKLLTDMNKYMAEKNKKQDEKIQEMQSQGYASSDYRIVSEKE